MPVKSVSVQLFTKPHIRAYLHNNFGERPLIDSTHIFHNYLLLCLAHSQHARIPSVPEYPVEMRIYISKIDYERHGCWMNPRQMQLFNIHVDFWMKALLVAHTDSYLIHKPGAKLKDALAYSLNELNVTDDDWDIETVQKSYYRSRIKRNKFLMYDKKSLKSIQEIKNL